MKKAEIYSVPSRGETGYAWKWRCSADRAQSERTFDLYHDCLTDARAHGYEVELTHAQGNTAPGGAEYHLRNRGDSGEQ